MEEKKKSSGKRWSGEEVTHLLDLCASMGVEKGVDMFLVSYPERTRRAAKSKLDKLTLSEGERELINEYKREEGGIIHRITRFLKRIFRR